MSCPELYLPQYLPDSPTALLPTDLHVKANTDIPSLPRDARASRVSDTAPGHPQVLPIISAARLILDCPSSCADHTRLFPVSSSSSPPPCSSTPFFSGSLSSSPPPPPPQPASLLCSTAGCGDLSGWRAEEGTDHLLAPSFSELDTVSEIAPVSCEN